MLFVPGDRPDRFSKAVAAGADAVIVDLEDAVAPERKAAARESVRAALHGGLDAWVRVNDVRSDEGARDLAMLVATPPAAVVIPKARSIEDPGTVRATLPEVGLVVMIESIDGVAALDPLSRAPGVLAIAFGAYDLCAELGARPTPEVLAPYRSHIVFTARAAGIAAIDSPYADLDDERQLALEAARAVDFGFDAKLAVHPKQIATIRAAFVPSKKDVADARAIVAAAGQGVVKLGSRMVDAPIVAAARRVIERAGGP